MKSILHPTAQRKVGALALALLLAPQLCACSDLPPERRELEQMQIIQTVGVDYAPGGVRLSLAAAAGADGQGPSPGLTGTGGNYTAALDRIRESSVEEELFLGHVQSLLVGQEAAEHGLDDLLGTVCRSADLRLDMPLYVVRGGSAEALMLGAGSGSRGITEILQAADSRSERRQADRSGTVAALMRSLSRSGGALVRALRYEKAAEDGGKTAVDAGLAVLAGGALAAWIEPEDALGVELLRGGSAARELSVLDLGGLPATLALQRGESRILPVWNEDGSLRGLDVLAQVRAAVLETAADSGEELEHYDDYLTAQLESAVSERIGRILRLERQLRLDFLELGERVSLASPERWHALDAPLGELLDSLEISITVRGELLHSYDSTMK